MKKKKFMVNLYLGHEKFFFYVGNRTLRTYLAMVKSFWGDNGVDLMYCCY
jgi:hypothetical protein